MATINGSVTLNTSKYNCYAVVTESNINTANNTSKVTVAFHVSRSNWGWIAGSFSGSIKIDGTSYSFSYTPNWNAGSSGDVTIATASKTVTHNADGKKNCSVSGSWNTSGTYSCGVASFSGSLTLTTILRQANIISAPNFNDEESPTVTYNNPAGSSVTKLEMAIYTPTLTVGWRDVSKTGSSYTFNLTENERNALRERLWNLNSRSVYFHLRTTIGGEQFLSYVEKTLTIVNANPLFNNFTYKDTNSTTVALTGNNQVSIGRYSNIEVKIPSANKMIAQKGATALKYNVIIGNKNKEITYGTGDVADTVSAVNSNVINLFAIDSRNNQTQVNKSINNINYTEVILKTIKFERKDGVGTTVIVTGNGNYDNVNFGSVINTIDNIQFRRKLTTTEVWSSWASITGLFTIAGGTITNKTLNEIVGTYWTLGSEYDVQVKITDKLSNHTVTGLKVSSGNVLMSALKDNGVCFGGLYDIEEGGVAQLNGQDIEKMFVKETKVFSGNIDYITETQFCYVGSNATGTRPLDGSNGFMVTHGSYRDSDYMAQVFLNNNGQIAFRNKRSGDWGNWVEVDKKEVIYEGNWSSGNITLNEPITNFKEVYVVMSGAGTYITCPVLRQSEQQTPENATGYLRGVGGYCSASTVYTFTIGATYQYSNPTVLTFVGCKSVAHTASSSHGAYTNETVIRLLGIR